MGVGEEEVVGSRGGDEEQRAELRGAFGGKVDRRKRVFGGMGDVLVEGGGVLLRDLVLGALPDRLHRVERLGAGVLLGVAVLGVLRLVLRGRIGQKKNGVGDVVGVAADDLAQPPGVDVFLLFLAEMERDRGSVLEGGVRLADLVVALAVGAPRDGGFAAAARHEFDGLRHHEGGVEAHAELTDHLGSVGALLHRLEELLRAGRGDRADVLLDLLARHADPVVRDDNRLGLLVRREADLVGSLVGLRRIGQRLEAVAVDGVRNVRNQFAEEDLLLRIERVDDEVEELADFSLEGFGFGLHGFLRGFRGQGLRLGLGLGLKLATSD